MKLSTKFSTLFATILSITSPCGVIAVGNRQGGKQLRGGAVGQTEMVVTEQELGKPQEEIMTGNENELDEVLIEEYDDHNSQDDDDDDETDQLQAFIKFVDSEEPPASPARKISNLVEEEEEDADDDLDEEGDDDETVELEAVTNFVNTKEKLDCKQKKGEDHC